MINLRRRPRVLRFSPMQKWKMKNLKQSLLENSQMHWLFLEESSTKPSRDLTGSRSLMSQTSCLTFTERLIMQETWVSIERERMRSGLADQECHECEGFGHIKAECPT